jgi:Ca2+ transporting ATPase
VGKFLQFQLVVNIVAITCAVVGGFAFGFSPLAAVQLLWINLIMDTLGSLALATEPPTDDLLKRKPYGRNDAVINAVMVKNILLATVFQLAVVLAILFTGDDVWMARTNTVIDPYGLPAFEQCVSYVNVGKVAYDTCVKKTHNAFMFNSFVYMTLGNQIVSRKLHDEFNIFEGMSRNPLFIIIVITCASLQAIIINFTGPVFKVLPLSALQWGYSILFGFCMLIYGTLMHTIRPFVSSEAPVSPSGAAVDPATLESGSLIAVKAQTSSIIAGAPDAIIRGISSSEVPSFIGNKRLAATKNMVNGKEVELQNSARKDERTNSAKSLST